MCNVGICCKGLILEGQRSLYTMILEKAKSMFLAQNCFVCLFDHVIKKQRSGTRLDALSHPHRARFLASATVWLHVKATRTRE